MIHKSRIHFIFYFFLVTSPSFSSSSSSEFGLHFTKWPTSRFVTPGQLIELACDTNLSPERVRWLHDHRFILPDGGETAEERGKKSSDGTPSSSVREGGGSPRTNSSDESSTSSTTQRRTPIGSRLILNISEIPGEFRLQEGYYQCVSSIGALAVTSLPGRIQIGYLDPFPSAIGPMKKTLRVKLGSSFKIPCHRPKALPEAKLQFYKDGVLLQTEDESKYFPTAMGDLVILKAEKSSKGSYRCSARNEFLRLSESNFSQTKVVVRKRKRKTSSNGPPRLTTFDIEIEIEKGENRTLMCVVTSGVADELYWSLDDVQLPQVILADDGRASLVLENVTRLDAGTYRCHGSNSLGHSIADVDVIVKESPFLAKKPDLRRAIAEGSNVTLSCEFGGFPVPSVVWIFGGNILTDDSTTTVIGGDLRITSVRLKQAGFYQCFGVNSLGTGQGSSLVTIIPKTIGPNVSQIENRKTMKRKRKRKKLSKEPNAGRMTSPSRPKLTKISDESIMVTWQLNVSDSLPIQIFKVQYKMPQMKNHRRIDEAGKWKTLDDDIASHVRSFEVTGLESGLVYRFRVVAIYVNNQSRLGPSSSKFLLRKATVLQPPERPPKILAIYKGKTTNEVIMEWRNDAISPADGFLVYYRDATTVAEYTKITILGVTESSYRINHLKQGRIYDFKLSSFNMAGRSNFSPIFTYVPADAKLRKKKQETQITTDSSPVPIVKSETDSVSGVISLYVSIGVGIAGLFLIVVVYFVYNSCKRKSSNSGETTRTDVETKFMDTSLRIHKQIKFDNDDRVSQSNSVPLLTYQRHKIVS